uniref:SF3 helicase domain-containing protein n=1 Tax=viral metagenome TaxID=1070528 RepID=A0A6C0BQN8_9ZZZZ
MPNSALQTERKLKSFLKEYESKKVKEGKITHTRIPKYYGDPKDKDPRNIYGGSWIIPENKIQEFHKLYTEHVFINGKKEYLTEAQKDNGQILIDLDFHYPMSIQRREDIYSSCDDDNWQDSRKDSITSILEKYLESLKEMLDINDKFPVYIFEKSEVVIVPDKKITKDGVHIIIGINLDRRLQEKLREMVLNKIRLSLEQNDFWIDMPEILNQKKWEDVIDYSIASGNTNWQLLGSQKPESDRYEISYGYVFELDSDNSWAYAETIDFEDDESKTTYVIENFMNLSANGTGKSFDVNTTFDVTSALNNIEKTLSPSNKIAHNVLGTSVQTFTFPDINTITNQYILDSLIEQMLLTDNLRPTDYERLKNTHEYCMILPNEYSEDYTLWKKVGWALKNADNNYSLQNRLFLTYLKFSSRSEKFKYEEIQNLFYDWKFKSKSGEKTLSERSIFYWARNANKEAFDNIKNNSIEHFINASFRSEGSDWDLACVLHQLYKDKFVLAGYAKNIWYQFIGHCWQESELGVELKKEISQELYNVYHDKTVEMVQIMSGLENHKDEWKDYQRKVTISSNICNKLKSNTSKTNIMSQCKELFFDKDFFELVDKNMDLLCCSNGVINLATKEFRRGYPEDYITKCTDIDYILPTNRDKKLEEEVKEYWTTMFPDESVGKYVWEVFASALSGTNVNQQFYIFLGAGSNGKSALMQLMRQVFNDKKKRGYYAQTPIQYLTQERVKAGSASSELAELIGARLTSIDEPQKHEKLNVGIMKQLTGGDPLTARALFKDHITFIPQFTFVALTNNLFEIAATDKGTWRRISVPPFKSTFTHSPYNDPEFPPRDYPIQHKKDPELLEIKFPLWKETVLSMLVETIFKTQGHVERCSIVDEEVKKYKSREDHIQQFIDSKIHVSEGNILKQRDLGIEFKEWYQDKYGSKIKRMQDLYDAMDKAFNKYGNSGWSDIDIGSEQ